MLEEAGERRRALLGAADKHPRRWVDKRAVAQLAVLANSCCGAVLGCRQHLMNLYLDMSHVPRLGSWHAGRVVKRSYERFAVLEARAGVEARIANLATGAQAVLATGASNYGCVAHACHELPASSFLEQGSLSRQSGSRLPVCAVARMS